MTLSRFVETNKDFEREFIFNEAPHHWDEQEYQQSINTTWTLKLQSTTDSARLLMDMLAFLDADGVPSVLFSPKAASDLCANVHQMTLTLTNISQVNWGSRLGATRNRGVHVKAIRSVGEVRILFRLHYCIFQ